MKQVVLLGAGNASWFTLMILIFSTVFTIICLFMQILSLFHFFQSCLPFHSGRLPKAIKPSKSQVSVPKHKVAKCFTLFLQPAKKKKIKIFSGEIAYFVSLECSPRNECPYSFIDLKVSSEQLFPGFLSRIYHRYFRWSLSRLVFCFKNMQA